MKNTKRILSGILAFVMVLSLCPVIAFAEEPADVTINIATMSNGTVTADKESYKVGDTVNLTIAPDAGYFQKLYIDGEPLMLEWKSKTYSFVAEKESYDITGSFVPRLDLEARDWGRWDDYNQAHGVLSTYYPNNGDSWWMYVKGDYKSLTVQAKNYLPLADTLDKFNTVLCVKMDNGREYTFRVYADPNGSYAYGHAGFLKDDGTSADWGSWKSLAELNDAISGDGVDYKVERTSANVLTLTVAGQVVDTYTMTGINASNKVVYMGVKHQGNQGEHIAIPFKASKGDVQVNLPTGLEHGSVTADKDSYEIGDTVTLTVDRENGYFQKLFINGEPLMHDWKTNSYSFVATEPVYDITGSFVRSINHTASDWGRWDDYNQGHNVLSTYYPTENDSWWMTFNGEYQSVTVGAKNYFAIADTKDNFMVYLKVTMDNGHSYNFRIYTDKGGYTAYSRVGIQNPGDASADWGNWKNLSKLDSLITTEGVLFKVERTGANTLVLTANGEVVDTYTMKGITADNKIASVAVKHQGNKGAKVEVPFFLQAVEAPAAEVIIPTFANGTVTADKESYKVGETVNLTINADAGYSQKLFINGKAVLLGWKTNTYSFVATETTYEITGSFEPVIDMTPSDAGRWDSANQAHGMLSTYYPVNNDGWWMNINGDYKSLAVIAKNHWAIADTLDNFMVVLKVTMDNGNSYLFRVMTDKGGYTAYNRAGIQNPGDASADWSGWKNMSKLDSLITTEGVQFKVDRTAANTLTLTLNGEVVDTYTMNGITADNKIASISVKHQGNKGALVEMAYTLELPHVHTAADAVVENEKAPTCVAGGSYDSVVYCSDCGAQLSRETITTEATGEHTYVDGVCTGCGAAEEVVPTIDENLTIVGKDMLLGGYIGAQFTVNPEVTGNYDSVYIVVVFDGLEFTYNVPLYEGAHVFEHRVAPKYMGEALQITAYGVKGEEVIPGVTVEWSIKDGIMERLAKFYPYIKHEVYKNRCILLVDMLYYGAEAQVRFGTNGNGLVTDGLDEGYAALKTATEPTIEKVNTATQTASNQLYQVNLGVEDAVQMQFTFRLKVEDYSQYLVKITANGTTYEYTGESFIPQGDTSTLKKFVTVVFDKLEAVNMRDEITVELWQNGALVSASYTMSIEGFATASIAKGENVALLKAMIAYGDSAKVSLG